MRTVLVAAATLLVLGVLIVREFAVVLHWRESSAMRTWLNRASVVLVVLFLGAAAWQMSGSV